MWELYAMWSWFLVFAGDELYADRTDAAFVTFAVIAAGGLGCVAGGIAGDRVGRPETTAACMAVSGLCALSIGFVPHGLALTIALVWGFTVVADSAQFSTLVTEHADQAYVGTALTLQLAVGFTLTVATIWLIPYLVDAAGWGWAFAFLAAGPSARRGRDAPAQVGSVTVRRSPSSVTSAPSTRSSRTATAAPRSFCSSPSTTGAAAATTGVDRDARPVDGRRDVDATVARSCPGERSQRLLHRVRIDIHRRPRAGRAFGRQLERVRLAQDRVVAAALDPRRERDEVEQHDELVGGGVDQRQVAAGLLAVELLEPEQRLREARDGCERRAEVMTGERDQTGKVGGHGAASVTAWRRSQARHTISRRPAPRCDSRSPARA